MCAIDRCLPASKAHGRTTVKISVVQRAGYLIEAHVVCGACVVLCVAVACCNARVESVVMRRGAEPAAWLSRQ